MAPAAAAKSTWAKLLLAEERCEELTNENAQLKLALKTKEK
jgi:hypothetical protein